ncbi:unnamed protein product [Prunus armeniaca]
MEDGKYWYFAKNTQLKLVTGWHYDNAKGMEIKEGCEFPDKHKGRITAEAVVLVERKEGRQRGLGGCIWDYNGPTGLDAIGTELAAIRKGLFLMQANNIGNVVEDIRRLMVDLAVSRVLFQLWSSNGVAHALAQFGLSEGTTFVWEDVASPWLESSLARDMELGQILTRPSFISGPDPNSTLESEPNLMRVRHLAGAGHK